LLVVAGIVVLNLKFGVQPAVSESGAGR